MIIQCEQCQTRFRLDDAKVTAKGVKVRCAKCKHVFSVVKDEPSEFTPPVAVAPMAEQELENNYAAPVDGVAAESTAGYDSAMDNEWASFRTIPETAPENVATPLESPEAPLESREPGLYDNGWIENYQADFAPLEPAPASPIQEESFLADNETEFLAAKDVDDLFGNGNPGGRSAALFAEDSMFGEVIPSPLHHSLSPEDDSNTTAEKVDSSLPPSLFEQSSYEIEKEIPDNIHPEVSSAYGDFLVNPLVDEKVGTEDQGLIPPVIISSDKDGEEELAPVMIASRRKESGLPGWLMPVIGLAVASVLGFFGYTTFFPPTDTTVTAVSEAIQLRGVKAAFTKNETIGELLVITGEAVNGFKKERGALQVKVILFDQSGKSIMTKSAYCGNPLTADQLKTMPLDRIEAAMANQFGDSMINTGIAPGKAVPFVVVLANVPPGAKDFGVEPATP